MRLDEYLKAIKECPDEQVPVEELSDKSLEGIWKLTYYFGVYDNYPLYLNAGFDKIVSDLTSSNYDLDSINRNEEGSRHYLLNYKLGSIVLQVFEKAGLGMVGEGIAPKTNIQRGHFNRIQNDFNRLIILHPYQKKQVPGVHWLRPLVIVIDDICEYAQREKMPICLPKTSGSGLNLSIDERFDRIVYYYP